MRAATDPAPDTLPPMGTGHVEDYIAHRQAMGELAASSAAQIAAVLHRWERHAGADPSAWTVEVVAAWVHGDEQLAASYRRDRLAKLRRYCRWLHDRGLIASNPTVDVAQVRVPDGAPRDLTLDEVGALVEVLPDDRARLIVVVMLQCGLRVGDLCRVRTEDVDWSRRRLHVRGKGGRGEPTHWVPIPAEAWELVEPRLGRPGPLVRSTRYRRRVEPLSPNHVGRLIRGWMSDAGVKQAARDGISSHALRHSCAQHLVDAGVSIRHVQAVLGHRSEATTEAYVRREPPGLRAAVEGRRYLAAS